MLCRKIPQCLADALFKISLAVFRDGLDCSLGFYDRITQSHKRIHQVTVNIVNSTDYPFINASFQAILEIEG